MTAQPTDSPEAALLLGLQALLQPLAPDLRGTLGQLPPKDPDLAFALAYTQGPTDPLGRWGQGVLTLLTRGPRNEPLTVHGLASPLVRRLTGLAGLPLGLVSLNTSEHRGSMHWTDQNERTVRVDTFFLDLDYQA